MATILLAEDDERVRYALALLLREAGHEVHEADCGQTALAALDAFTPDLLVTDVYMPVLDGIELIQTFRRANQEVPVLAITGGGMQSNPALAADLAKLTGADRALHKPITNDVLLKEVAELVSQGRAGDAPQGQPAASPQPLAR